MTNRPRRAAWQNGRAWGSEPDSTTARPDFHRLVAEHERHTLWRYNVRDLSGELVMVSSEPITRIEAEKSIRMHFGDRLIALRPGGER